LALIEVHLTQILITTVGLVLEVGVILLASTLRGKLHLVTAARVSVHFAP
jgi:hypothetical protein